MGLVPEIGASGCHPRSSVPATPGNADSQQATAAPIRNRFPVINGTTLCDHKRFIFLIITVIPPTSIFEGALHISKHKDSRNCPAKTSLVKVVPIEKYSFNVLARGRFFHKIVKDICKSTTLNRFYFLSAKITTNISIVDLTNSHWPVC